MKKGIFGLAGLTAGIALICFCGDSGTNTPAEQVTNVPISSLRLDNNAVAGWVDTGYLTGDTNNITVSIDGEAELYKSLGMQYYAQQTMIKGVHNAWLLAIDFATIQNAKNMYNRKKEFGLAWGTYDPEKVIINAQEFQTVVYARLNKYFIQLTFSVDGDSVGTVANANTFYSKFVGLLQ
jgi:hypothetical protein